MKKVTLSSGDEVNLVESTDLASVLIQMAERGDNNFDVKESSGWRVQMAYSMEDLGTLVVIDSVKDNEFTQIPFFIEDKIRANTHNDF